MNKHEVTELDGFEAGWLACYSYIKGHGDPPTFEEFKEAVSTYAAWHSAERANTQ